MSFWDGERWVSALPPRAASSKRRHRVGDLLATLVMVVLVAAWTIPYVSTQAGSPTLEAKPNSAPAGTTVEITGTDFPARSRVQLTFDGVEEGMPATVVGGNGRVKLKLTVPDVSVGEHTIGAVEISGPGKPGRQASRLAAVIASTMFSVTSVAAVEPTPAPTLAPTSSPAASASPSSAPTTPPASASPAPATPPPPTTDPAAATPSPTPIATANPTPTPTATPKPTATPVPTLPPGPPIAYGVFEDAVITDTAAEMDALITDLRAHNLPSAMFTNGFVRYQEPMASVADSRGFPIYTSWLMGELHEQWWPSSVSADIDTARRVIGPLVDKLKAHPSIRGYNIIDDATPDRNEKMRLAVQVIRERHPGIPASPMMVSGDLGRQVYDGVRPDVFLTYEYPANESNTACSWVSTFVSSIRYRTASKPSSVPLWLVLQVHSTSWGPTGTKLRVPTVEEVRLQNWVALGEGARGIWWFIYSSQQGWKGLRDQPALYAEVADNARRTTAFPQFSKQADLFSAGSNYASTMTDSTGARYVLAANTSCSARSVTVTSSTLTGTLVDMESGQTFSLGQAISMRGGDGRIFRHVP